MKQKVSQLTIDKLNKSLQNETKIFIDTRELIEKFQKKKTFMILLFETHIKNV